MDSSLSRRRRAMPHLPTSDGRWRRRTLTCLGLVACLSALSGCGADRAPTAIRDTSAVESDVPLAASTEEASPPAASSSSLDATYEYRVEEPPAPEASMPSDEMDSSAVTSDSEPSKEFSPLPIAPEPSGLRSRAYSFAPAAAPAAAPPSEESRIERDSTYVGAAAPDEAVMAEQAMDEAPPQIFAMEAEPTQSAEPAMAMDAVETVTDAPAIGGIVRAQGSSMPSYIERTAAGHWIVQVFYATDRKAVEENTIGMLAAATRFVPAAIMGFISALIFAISWASNGRLRLTALKLLSVGCALALAALPALLLARGARLPPPSMVYYGNERGQLRLGTCEVAIPPDHRKGALESPSLLRLEIRENTDKHVVFVGATPLGEDDFYARLRERLAQASRQEVFVFVHGFNVSFEDAARRTAQMAFDLKYDGAPLFYSWPARGGRFEYTVDETNVEWTVPHLKQFLLEVGERSGATTINLIAHSMGNRALTNALRQLAYETDQRPLFREVILTAPDIDAEIFRRDIVPAIKPVAKRVTLYASSNDEALVLSKRIHGFARAGDSGEQIIVVPGIDTIDVSEVDTTLIGHTYYGENDSVLTDLIHLLHEAAPPEQRQWLERRSLDGLPYWAFHGRRSTAAALGARLAPR